MDIFKRLTMCEHGERLIDAVIDTETHLIEIWESRNKYERGEEKTCMISNKTKCEYSMTGIGRTYTKEVTNEEALLYYAKKLSEFKK